MNTKRRHRCSWRRCLSVFDRGTNKAKRAIALATKGISVLAGSKTATSQSLACDSRTLQDPAHGGPVNLEAGLELVPGYRLIRMLGFGSYGQVWLATGPGEIDVALKIVLLNCPAAWKEFRAVSWYKNIRHPHLLPIIALWLLDGAGAIMQCRSTQCQEADDWQGNSRPAVCVVAMPVAEKSLADLLRECHAAGHTGMPITPLLQYMQEVADALDYLNAPRHKLDSRPFFISHRDVKPENVLLLGDSAVLADFGVARIVEEDATKATCLVGTPAFMSPECANGERIGTTTDQYSLALMYYFLRTGCLPLPEGISLRSAICRQQTGDLDLSRIHPLERAVVKTATEIEPRRRYESCRAFVEALRNAVLPTAVPAGPSDDQPDDQSDPPPVNVSVTPETRLSLRNSLARLFPRSTLVSLWDEFFEVYDAVLQRCSPADRGSSVSEQFPTRVWSQVQIIVAESSSPRESNGSRRWFANLVRFHAFETLRHDHRAISEPARPIGCCSGDESVWETIVLASVLQVLVRRLPDAHFAALWLRTVEGRDVEAVASALSLPPDVIVNRHDYALRKLRLGLALFSGESLDTYWTLDRVEAIGARLFADVNLL